MQLAVQWEQKKVGSSRSRFVDFKKGVIRLPLEADHEVHAGKPAPGKEGMFW
jgi:hypothetical protein